MHGVSAEAPGFEVVVGPARGKAQVGLDKDVRVREGSRIEVRMEAFNFLNKTNLGTPNSNRSSAAFGTITSLTQPAREIQLAVRYAF